MINNKLRISLMFMAISGILLLALMIVRFKNPDTTQARFFLDYWWLYIATVVSAIISGWFLRE